MSLSLRLSPLPNIKELLQIYKVRALKKLSQNFLLDLRITDKIVRNAGCITDGEVCEVGPGPGSLTRSIIMKSPSKMILVEKDIRFQPILEELADCCPFDVDLLFCDIKGLDISKKFSPSLKKDWHDEPPNIHVLANLPFDVSTYLIVSWLKDISLRRNFWSLGRVKMTLTFQHEVAERMIAPEFSKFRCRLSVMSQIFSKVFYKFTISGRSFLPKPKVDVGVVHFEPLKEPLIPLPFEVIEKVVRTIFNSPNKYCKPGIMKLFPPEYREDLTQKLLTMADVPYTVRVKQLSNQDWKQLCMAYSQICDEDPRLYRYDFRAPRLKRDTTWKIEPEEVAQFTDKEIILTSPRLNSIFAKK